MESNTNLPSISINDIVQSTQGRLRKGAAVDAGTVCLGVQTDSRAADLKGSLFIPLVGDNFDGHDFVAKAVAGGAASVLVHRWDPSWEPLLEKAQFVEVTDTLKALQDLGAHWRHQLGGLVLGISGSNGKTTTKDFTRQLLEQQGPTTASRGSYNNHWGVPLSLLSCSPDDGFAVMEMGMNHPGELTALNGIASPDIVCVTNVGKAHLGFFESVDAIAAAKKELYDSAPDNAVFVFNRDNAWTRGMLTEFSSRDHFMFSLEDPTSDVYFRLSESTGKGFRVEGHIGGVSGSAVVGFWGDHNLENLAAAATLCFAAKIPPEKIWSSLPVCQLGWGRSQWLESHVGPDFLFDAYNANPESFRVLLQNVKEHLQGKHQSLVGVFGEMLELGDKAAFEHEELGRRLAEVGPWEHIYFVGPSGASVQRGWLAVEKQKKLNILNTYEELLDLNLPNVLSEHSLVVVKGSRGLRLERLVDCFDPIGFSKKP